MRIIWGDCLDVLPTLGIKPDMVYADPPFGTGTDRDSYVDDMPLPDLLERLDACVDVLAPGGTLYVHLDYRRVHEVAVHLARRLPLVSEIVWRVGWVSGFRARTRGRWVMNHNTVLQLGTPTYAMNPSRQVTRSTRPGATGRVAQDTWWDDLPSEKQMSYKRTQHRDRWGCCRG